MQPQENRATGQPGTSVSPFVAVDPSRADSCTRTIPPEPASAGMRAERAPAAGGDGKGTESSNTVPNNSKPSGNDGFIEPLEGVNPSETYFQPLRWGVDSLYLSYRGEMEMGSQIKLESLKKLAQSKDGNESALAQLAVGDHLFEVKDRGAGLFPYVLEDAAFRIQLAKVGAKSIPAAYVKVSSGALAARTPEDIEAEVSALLGGLLAFQDPAKVSRIDLFVDFASSVNMEGWDRSAWVTRAGSINTYSSHGVFSGWTVGLGGPISCRLYNKLLEIVEQSKKDYLLPLWQQAGWDTETPVWRLEFEVKQPILSQLDRLQFDEVMDSLGGIWDYATCEWLRLTIPSASDATRSRWPVHPLWACLASVDWDSPGGALTRTFPLSRAPSNARLMQFGLGAVVSHMASHGVSDLEDGLRVFCEGLWEYVKQKAYAENLPLASYLNARIATKIRQYNTAETASFLGESERQRKRREAEAEAYRRASNGE